MQTKCYVIPMRRNKNACLHNSLFFRGLFLLLLLKCSMNLNIIVQLSNCSLKQILIMNSLGQNFHPNCIESVILTVECIAAASWILFFCYFLWQSTPPSTFLPCDLLYIQCKLSLQVKQTNTAHKHTRSTHNK